MTLLDANACTAFCAQLGESFGGQIVSAAVAVGTLLLVWRNNKKAKEAKQSAQDAHAAIARIEGSLHPPAPTKPEDVV